MLSFPVFGAVALMPAASPVFVQPLFPVGNVALCDAPLACHHRLLGGCHASHTRESDQGVCGAAAKTCHTVQMIFMHELQTLAD